MTITSIRAHFECDACGKRFFVEMDGSDQTNRYVPSVHDLAEETLRGGNPISGECGSVQDDLHLCGDCTSIADEIGDEDHKPTRAEILNATGAL